MNCGSVASSPTPGSSKVRVTGNTRTPAMTCARAGWLASAPKKTKIAASMGRITTVSPEPRIRRAAGAHPGGGRSVLRSGSVERAAGQRGAARRAAPRAAAATRHPPPSPLRAREDGSRLRQQQHALCVGHTDRAQRTEATMVLPRRGIWRGAVPSAWQIALGANSPANASVRHLPAAPPGRPRPTAQAMRQREPDAGQAHSQPLSGFSRSPHPRPTLPTTCALNSKATDTFPKVAPRLTAIVAHRSQIGTPPWNAVTR